MSANLTTVLQRLLQNTSNLEVLRQLRMPDATYASLNFDNPELKKVEPWADTHMGPQALSDVFAAVQRFSKTLKVINTIDPSLRSRALLELADRLDERAEAIALRTTVVVSRWRASN